MTYRPIKSTEYDVLKKFLYEAVFIPDGVAPPPFDVIFSPSLCRYIEDFGRTGDICIVCEHDGAIVGAAWSRILDEPDGKGYGNIGDGIPELTVSVLPEYRNRGIGTELLERPHLALGAEGYDRISLSAQEENPALRLYERCGYKLVKEQARDYIMVKWLAGKGPAMFDSANKEGGKEEI
jgi:ribosomal protein S18 acetylase RimI-like enzyme